MKLPRPQQESLFIHVRTHALSTHAHTHHKIQVNVCMFSTESCIHTMPLHVYLFLRTHTDTQTSTLTSTCTYISIPYTTRTNIQVIARVSSAESNMLVWDTPPPLHAHRDTTHDKPQAAPSPSRYSCALRLRMPPLYLIMPVFVYTFM